MGMSHRPGQQLSFFDKGFDQAAANETYIESKPGPARHAERKRWIGIIAAAAAASAVVMVPGPSASADPSANAWYRLRMCESSNNYSINTGNNHYGAYQFDLSTWRSVGGTGYPNRASAAEQDARALILYRQRGWQPWQCAGIVGLREDGDARSGRISDIKVPRAGVSSGGSASGIPTFPGSRWYNFGDRNASIKRFQDQMHKRGFFPVGTGEYGPNTLAMVKRLQSLNGLVPNGYIGPNTWRLAWTGKYTIAIAATPKPRASSIPAFPGSRWYHFGDRNASIKRFQDRMHARGFFPVGTGEYGPNTLAMVKRLQSLNGLVPNGLIGPNTWRLAWTGKYS
ncbi:MAG: resuscitation-promoting factor RpfA [Pseudonocardiales bacterium]|nr:resuscitation-promoting factor RpfA [Pseudonocardiales bacterium]